MNIFSGTLNIPSREAGVTPDALFTKAWASGFEDYGPGQGLVGTTTEGAGEAEQVGWSLDTALDVASIGASCRVARAEGLVTGAVEDIILVLGMLARRCVTAFVTRCTMASMMPGETGSSWLEGPAEFAELGDQQLLLKLMNMVGLKVKVRQDELHWVGLQSALDLQSVAASLAVGCLLPPERLGLRVLERVMSVVLTCLGSSDKGKNQKQNWQNRNSNERVNCSNTSNK